MSEERGQGQWQYQDRKAVGCAENRRPRHCNDDYLQLQPHELPGHKGYGEEWRAGQGQYLGLIATCLTRTQGLWRGKSTRAGAVPWACKSLGQPPSTGLQAGCPSSAASAALPLSHLASEDGAPESTQHGTCDSHSSRRCTCEIC